MFGRVNVSLYFKKSQLFHHDRVAAVSRPAESRSVVSVDEESTNHLTTPPQFPFEVNGKEDVKIANKSLK